VNYQDGSIVSRDIVKKPTGNVTIFALDEGQGLSEHTAPFDALAQVLEGEVEISIAGQPHHLHGGETPVFNQKRHDRPSGHAQGIRAQETQRQTMTALRTKRTAVRVERSIPKKEPAPIVLTIGHSTRTLEEFISLLKSHSAVGVADVRTVPRSQHNPQFNKASFPKALKKVGLGYVHLPGLGGLRHAKSDSVNLGWRNASFRGYADYMQTPEFEQSLVELLQLAKQNRIAIMCAEALPWRCHRSLIADALLVRGIHAEDIMSPTRRQVHTLTPFAKVRGTTITYPAGAAQSTPEKPSVKRPGPRQSKNLIRAKN
jgi:hypothetical protein